MKAGNESGIPIFVPSCDDQGGYKQVQCHEGDNKFIICLYLTPSPSCDIPQHQCLLQSLALICIYNV